VGNGLLRLPIGFRARPLDARKRVPLAPLQQADRFLVLELPRILLQRLLEAFQGASRAVLLDVAEAELKAGVLGVGLSRQRLFELGDRARDIPLFPQDGAEQDPGGRNRSDFDRPGELPLRFIPVRPVGVKRLRSIERVSRDSASSLSPRSEAEIPE